jgi:hypothetical protein
VAQRYFDAGWVIFEITKPCVSYSSRNVGGRKSMMHRASLPVPSKKTMIKLFRAYPPRRNAANFFQIRCHYAPENRRRRIPPAQRQTAVGRRRRWLIGISRNLAKDLRRSLAVYDWLFVNEERADLDVRTVPSPEERLLAKEELKVIARLRLRQLNTRSSHGQRWGIRQWRSGRRLGWCQIPSHPISEGSERCSGRR